MTTVEARCKALTSRGAQAGSSITRMSGSLFRFAQHFFQHDRAFGSSEALPPARTSWQSK